MGLFNWLRNRVKDACLAGVADAVQELDANRNGQADAVKLLRLTLAEDAQVIDAEVEPAAKRKTSRA